MSPSRRLRVLVVLMSVVAACSVPTDETAQEIDPEQLPESLRPDFTTTTTTTVPAPVTEPATVFLLEVLPDTERRVVVGVSRDVQRGASVQAVLSTLFGGEMRTEAEQEAGYSNALFELALDSAIVEGDVAIVDIVPLTPEGEPSDEPFTGDLIGAAAQLVFTASEFDDIIGIQIHINGEEVSVPTNDGDADPGATLRTSDYEQFDPDFVPATTTTTTATTTSAPPVETPDTLPEDG